MLKINDTIIELDKFGDGTLKIKENIFSSPLLFGMGQITWCYEDDSELFALWNIVGYLRERRPKIELELVMPYIPNARQDRQVSGRVFTLKYFAKLINEMNFSRVYVLDPHSDVSMALIDRIKQLPSPFLIPREEVTVMYPDNGAAKKYSCEGVVNPIIGNKHRGTDGRIDRYELVNFVPGTKNVIIRDDICSYGGTFVAAAKELRKHGVENISLVVSHCENNILKGEVFNYIDEVFTTDSIFTESHPKVIVTRCYRGEKNEIKPIVAK